MSTENSSDERDPVERLAEEFVARHRRGEPRLAGRVRRALPAVGRADPRAVPGALADGAAQARSERPDATLPDGDGPAAGAAGAAGRLPDHPRDRPRRHGRRLRGRAGVARPPRGPEGPAAAHAGSTRGRRPASSARPARRRGCTTPTSCRSSASASTTGVHYYVMQFIPGQALDEVLREVRRLRRQGIDDPAAGGGRSCAATATAPSPPRPPTWPGSS